MTFLIKTRLLSTKTLSLIVLTAAVMDTIGCGDGPSQAAPVNTVKAQDALKTTLERWKSGGKCDELKAESPSITVQDLDWEGGKSLVAFEILDDGKNDDANLRVSVDLTLRDKGGREQKKKVKYVVGTSPVITVFREIF